MTPNRRQELAAQMLALYADAEERMLAIVARRLAKGIEGPGWANHKLEEVQQVRAELQREVERLGIESKAIRTSMLEQAWDGAEEEFARELGLDIRSIPSSRLLGIASIENELNDKFDALQSAILRQTDDQYRSIIGQVVAVQATGAITTKQALQQALNELAAQWPGRVCLCFTIPVL